MAKQFVKISLATKFRVLFGASALGIIAVALIVPWYFLEMLTEQSAQQPAVELMRLRQNEWKLYHSRQETRDRAEDEKSDIVSFHAPQNEPHGRKGPLFIKLKNDMTTQRPLDSSAKRALKTFSKDPDRELIMFEVEDEPGKPTYRFLQAVHMDKDCMSCHGDAAPVNLQYQPGQLAGLIDLTIPIEASAGILMWYTRGAFVVGGFLAAVLALILFAVITHRLVLRPVRILNELTDKVADGDMTVRSPINTSDELQRLGDSFNEMLDGIQDQHNKLRAANRALDLKLSEMEESNVTLFQANKVKTEFMANMSHELRTPLNSILGFADLVSESTDERIARYGKNINSAAKNLLNMIIEILDLAKIEAGKAEVRFDKVSITDTCETLIALMNPQAQKKQLELEVKLAEDLPLVTTDGGKVQQVLYNLLSNAIKFTPAGGRITLSTELGNSMQNGGESDEVAISVEDNGPGIAEADQQMVFEKFHQLDKTLTKESAGTGLGLAISKELASLMGGRLVLESEPGHGSKFTLHIPIEPKTEK